MLMPRNDSAPACYGLTYANGGEGGKTQRSEQKRMIRPPPGVAADRLHKAPLWRTEIMT